jgi:C4-dicarboxylate-specific signal transduction histidine kinase
LGRVQQDNQRQVVGKLLHDLRNPVHAIRISMELFGRLVRRNGDVEKLTQRAVQYIDPAEAAVASLVANSDRLSRYLAAPAAPETQAVSVDDLLAEVTMLMRAAKRGLQVTSTLPEPPSPAVRADRMRLCHVLIHSCLNNPASAVTISVRQADGVVTFDLAFQAGGAEEGVRTSPLRTEELQAIVETAGGAVIAVTDSALSLEFRRASDPPPG